MIVNALNNQLQKYEPDSVYGKKILYRQCEKNGNNKLSSRAKLLNFLRKRVITVPKRIIYFNANKRPSSGIRFVFFTDVVFFYPAFIRFEDYKQSPMELNNYHNGMYC